MFFPWPTVRRAIPGQISIVGFSRFIFRTLRRKDWSRECSLSTSTWRKFLVGFAFVDCDDFEIVTGPFQHNRFVDLTGRMFVAIAQFVPERKRHLNPIVILRLDRDVAVEPETPLRPARRVSL